MKLQHFILATLCLGMFSYGANAQTIVVKLATVAPKDTPWYDYLLDLKTKWAQVSGGRVKLKIYAGTLGDEIDILRRMRIGQIDAATVTTAGLSTMDEAANALHIPLAFSSYAELEYVQSRIAGPVAQALRKKGIVVLNWGDAGWVRFFAKSPVRIPDDLRKLKLFVWTSGKTTDTEELWKKLGFNPVPLSSVDILTALQTGMISAYQAPPLVAVANQWFAFTGSMTDMRWAPLTGATVISTKAWSRIPEDLRPKLIELAQEAGVKLRDQVRQLEQNAIDAMTKRGLSVVALSPGARAEWQQLAISVYPQIRGKIVPAQYFDEVLRLRDEYRAAHPVRLIESVK
ncbi:MAG: TRAP transporter substrate-binding protein DctP [Acidiferrobacterales bacterium]